MTKFEDTFIVDINPVPLVVWDFNVSVFDIYRWYETISKSFNSEVGAKLIKGAFALHINRGPSMLPRHTYRMMFVADKRYAHTGNYWRNDIVRTSEVVRQAWVDHAEEKGVSVDTLRTDYKGNRGEKTQDFWFVYSICREYAEKYFPFFEETGYEADDWCGSIYRLSRDSDTDSLVKKRQIFLSTLDRDWSMCCDDAHKVYFANTRIPLPNEKIQSRLVDNNGVIAHTKHRMKFDIEHPRDLPAKKVLYSDEGDNLPKGTPIELFDLCEAHPVYNIDKVSRHDELVECVNDPKANTRDDHFEQALRQFVRICLEPPVKL